MTDYLTLVIAHKDIQCGEPEDLVMLFVLNQSFCDRYTRQDHLSSIYHDRDLETTG